MPRYNRGPCACCGEKTITGAYTIASDVRFVYTPNGYDYYGNPYFQSPYVGNTQGTPSVTYRITFSDGTHYDYVALLNEFKDMIVGSNTLEIQGLTFFYNDYIFLCETFRLTTSEFFTPTATKYQCNFNIIANSGSATWHKTN